ncbi:flagellar L-ring protein [Capsulimonas corticalis]|uniref:Flagellar L-ring protein n=1 Tax=Capsulimonas corticalis TaxID=2219043 RepID=A0A402CS93_9BACT|nr:flagellar basal body L-ring protein FlgH [Capsulimonas corticalis]BDI28303.1 flagellar L-ring protein [Capsulimonas corticalis]
MNRAIILAAILSLSAVQMASADSLYPGSSTFKATGTTSASLFADIKAHGVGDTLTIIVTETASTSSVANTKNSKNENFSYGPGIGPLLSRIPALGLSGSIGSTASGSTDRNDNLTARIAVTVKEILPNGNMLVEGKRKVGMNAETQEITLTGVIRPLDIGSDNTIPSPLVADAQIKYGGKGPVGDKQHDGIISRIFKFLF